MVGVSTNATSENTEMDERAVGGGGKCKWPWKKSYFPRGICLLPISRLRLRHVRFDDHSVLYGFGPGFGRESLRHNDPRRLELYKHLPKPELGQIRCLSTIFDCPPPPTGYNPAVTMSTNGVSATFYYKQIKGGGRKPPPDEVDN